MSIPDAVDGKDGRDVTRDSDWSKNGVRDARCRDIVQVGTNSGGVNYYVTRDNGRDNEWLPWGAAFAAFIVGIAAVLVGLRGRGR